MSELKPCPFCGGAATLQSVPPQDNYFVKCHNCAASTMKYFRTPEEAKAAWNRRAQPTACEIAEYAEDCKDCGFCAQPANEPLTKIGEMLEQAAQDMDDKCRQWRCVLRRVHSAGTFDQNIGLWVGIDKERAAKAQASFAAYHYALGVIDKIS